MKRAITVGLLSIFAIITPAKSQDIEAGEKVFKKCSPCHSADKEKNGLGPYLLGVVDRPAGSVEGFKYSKALLEQADGGLVWTVEDITEYLRKPSAKIKGTKMAFPGLKKDEDISNVIAYLQSQPAQ